MPGRSWVWAAVCVVIALPLASCSSSSAPKSHAVTLSLMYDYKVQVDVVLTYGGQVLRRQVFLPWTGSSKVPSGTQLSVTSTAPAGLGGLLTCSIVEDGRLVATVSQPAGDAVTCSHKV